MHRLVIPTLSVLLLALTHIEVKVTAASLDIGDNDLGDLGERVRSSKPETKSFELTSGDEEGVRHLGDVIEALERLGVLSARREHCYVLVDIVRTTRMRDARTGSTSVSVAINLRQLKPANSDATSEPDAEQVTSGVTTPTSLEGAARAATRECLLRGVALDVVDDRWRGTDLNDSTSGPGTDRNRNRTTPASSGVTKTRTEEDDDGHRLSKTQVMVISTCSVVIGLFFIVAVIIRINNYIKRMREEQAAARRPSFRSTSFSLNSTANSHLNANSAKDVRLEAALNKDDTERVAMAIKDEDDEGDVTPRMSSQENRPLLIVTAASAPSSPCPQRARSDYQYSNGEDDAAMTADETSGHGTSFSSTRGQHQADETPPAPRGQRLNRVHKKLSYTRVGGGEHDAPSSLQEEEDSETGDEQLGHVNPALGSMTPTDEQQSAPANSNNSQHPKAERLMSFSSTDRECFDDTGSNDSSRMVEWDMYDSFSEDSYQKHSLDIDYRSAGGQHCPMPVLSSIPEGVDIDGVGFTQSDSSISSNNPSYRYGNQVEYTGIQQYPNVEYVPRASVTGPQVPRGVVSAGVGRTVSGEVPRSLYQQESTDSNVVIRQVSDDSLLYNDSPNLLRRTSHVQESSLEEEEKQDFWLEEEADDDDTSPNDVRDRFGFPNDRFGFREDRLPNILEDDSGGLDHQRSAYLGQEHRPLSNKAGGLPRQKQSIRDDITSDPMENSDSDPMTLHSVPAGRGRPTQMNGEVGGSRSSDSDTSETVSINLLPPQQNSRSRKKRHRRSRHTPGWSLLQDPDFEGMEPTYV